MLLEGINHARDALNAACDDVTVFGRYCLGLDARGSASSRGSRLDALIQRFNVEFERVSIDPDEPEKKMGFSISK